MPSGTSVFILAYFCLFVFYPLHFSVFIQLSCLVDTFVDYIFILAFLQSYLHLHNYFLIYFAAYYFSFYQRAEIVVLLCIVNFEFSCC